LGIFFVAATFLAGQNLLVVDDAGHGVAGALVDFRDRAGAEDLETTDAQGLATAGSSFVAVSADVAKGGYVTAHVAFGNGPARLLLERALPAIGSVSVATGSRQTLHELPLAASVLDRSTIALSPAAASDALLRQLPGADETRSNSAFTNYGDIRASFGGAGLDRGVVLVDGIPAQDAFGGQIDWEAYPVDTIERIELLRGAGSALYGSGGVGGVLEVDTFGPHPGPNAVADGAISLGAGTNAAADEAFLLRAPLSSTVAASLTTVATRLEYQDLPPAYSAPIVHTAIGQSGVSTVKLAYASGRTTIGGGGLFGSDHQDEGLPNYTFDRFLHQENVSATQSIGSFAVASFGYYVRDTTVYNVDDIFPTKPAALRYIQHVPTDENGFFSGLTAQAGPVEFTLRLDQKRVTGQAQQYGPTGAVQSFGTGTELSQGIALQGTYRAHRFEAVAGARADRLRYDDLSLLRVSGTPAVTTISSVAGHDEGAISPRVALRYDVGSRLAARVSSGGGFRGPYLNELVRGFNVGAVFDAPNPHLVPERSRTDDAGLDYLVGEGRIALDVFATHVDDAIAFVTISKTEMMRENLSRTQTNGETLTYAQPVGPCARLRVSGTSQTPRVTSGPPGTVGKQLELVPNDSVDVGLDAAGHGPLSYSVDGSYLGQTYADSLQAEPLGRALLFGATVRATTASGTTFTLVGENLTHQLYLTNVNRYGPPLTVSLHVAVPLGRRTPANPAACGTVF
jgi:outer membrane receptor protein involved in Fe transport